MSSLAVKAALGALQLLAVLAILLFLPARTFDYPQAWAYLALFATAVVLITAYLLRNDPALLERRVEAGFVAERRPQQKVLQVLAACAFASIFGIAANDYRFGWSHLPPALEAAGLLVVAIGFALVFVAFRENSFAAGTIDVFVNQRIVASGPYARLRHPMYAGALVLLYGTPLALGSYWALVAVFALTLLLVVRILDEERFLRESLSGYAEYARRVRYRLVPYVW